MLFNEACHRNVNLEHPMFYNETNDGRDDSSGSDNFLIDSVPGVVRMETEGCDCLKEEADRRGPDDYLVKCQIQDALKLTARELGHLRLCTTPQDTETIPFGLEVHLPAVSLGWLQAPAGDTFTSLGALS